MRTHRPAVLATSGLAVFLGLTVLVWIGALDGLDRAVADFAGRNQTSAGVTVARVVTDVLSPGVDAVVLMLGAGVLTARRRRLQPVVVAFLVLWAVSAVVLGLKFAIDRPLPHSHGDPAQGFPSGHTAATVCFLGALALLASARATPARRRLLVTVAGLSALVVLALVSAGFHWLTDTVASLGLGVAVLTVVSRRTE